MRYNRISADCHLDMPWMPPDLFTSEASPELKDRMPYVTDGPDGPLWVDQERRHFRPKERRRPERRQAGAGPKSPRRHHGRDRPVRRRPEGHPPGQRSASAAQGHGPRRRRCRGDLRHPRLRLEAAGRRGSGGDVQDLQRLAEGFLQPLSRTAISVSPACPTATSSGRCRRSIAAPRWGLKGLELSCSWDMEPMWHPCWEPLWKAVDEVQLPLHFHTFPTTPPRAREMTSGQVRRAAMFTGVSAFQMGLIHILAAMIGAGRVRALSASAGVVRRERHRLDSIRSRPDGFRVRGPVPRPDEAEAERVLAAPVQGDVPVRSDRAEVAQREQPDDDGYADVGVRLPAHRRDLAGSRRSISTSSSRGCRRRTSARSPATTPRSSTI